jgi:nucleoside-diphosphate-sugar epimerase
MIEKKKILLLGSDGYLGSNLSSKLDRDLFCVDKYDLFPKSKETSKLDVKDIDKTINIMKGKFYDIVICLVGVLPGVYRKNKLYNENLSAVNFLKNFNIESHFIFCSSTAVYKNNIFYKEIKERPFEIYGQSKLDCEEIIKNNTSSHTIFRIGTMVSKNRSGGIMNILKRLKSGRLVWLPYGGKVVHPFVDVDDVVEAIKYACVEQVNGTFDLIANNRETINELAVQINPNQKILNSKLIDWFSKYFGFDQFPIFGISKWHLNALKYDLQKSKNKNIWNFTPLKSMREAIRKSIIY